MVSEVGEESIAMDIIDASVVSNLYVSVDLVVSSNLNDSQNAATAAAVPGTNASVCPACGFALSNDNPRV